MMSCTAFAQNADDITILETRFRNPIDTLTISKGKNPSIVLFVHSNCKKHNCATGKMLKALGKDSLDLRKNNNIKLFVVYPIYSKRDIAEFDSFNPQNATVAFDINRQYRASFSGDPNTTPFIVVFNGKGDNVIQNGGTYKDLYDTVVSFLKSEVSLILCEACNGKGITNLCPNCHGTKVVSQKEQERRIKMKDPDYWICKICQYNKCYNIPCTVCNETGTILK